MTKIQKFWLKIKFWQKLALILSPFAAGGEIALFLGDADKIWMYIVGGATILSVYITRVFVDQDGDGIVDLFQKDKKKKEGENGSA